MKFLALALVTAACSSTPAGTVDGPESGPQSYYGHVDVDQVRARLQEIVDLGERWSPSGKARFRQYWKDYFTSLGATVGVIPFPVDKGLVGETQGHDLEAVLPGASPDSVVIVVHYDSVGIAGHEASNPAADDDGSGLAMQLEAGRLFAAAATRDKTVRFVAADYEEISDNLAGDVAYVDYLQREAQTHGFQILVASDNDQTGWSCWSEDACGDNPAYDQNTTFYAITCSGDFDDYDYPDLAAGITDVAAQFAPELEPSIECDGSGDTDHYPFWQAGIPAYVIEEYGSENNPHFDNNGDDTMAHIDFGYLGAIARVQIQLQAQLAGIN